MYTVYARDNNETRRSLEDFSRIFRPTIPDHIRIENVITVKQGFIVKFPFPNDTNHAFASAANRICETNNLEIVYSRALAFERELFLTDPPEDIFAKDPNEIKSEIAKITSENILKVKPLPGKSSGRKYLIISTESKTSRDAIIAKGPIQLFDRSIKVELPIDKNIIKPNNHATPYRNYNRPERFPAQAHNNLRRPQSGSNTSGQMQGTCGPPPPPPSNAWDRNNHWPHLRSQFTPQANFPHYQSPQKIADFANDNYLKFFIFASSHLSKELNEGIEHPFKYISDVNEIYTNHGLPPIDIPHNQLINSRNVFMRKAKTLNVAQPISTGPAMTTNPAPPYTPLPPTHQPKLSSPPSNPKPITPKHTTTHTDPTSVTSANIPTLSHPHLSASNPPITTSITQDLTSLASSIITHATSNPTESNTDSSPTPTSISITRPSSSTHNHPTYTSPNTPHSSSTHDNDAHAPTIPTPPSPIKENPSPPTSLHNATTDPPHRSLRSASTIHNSSPPN